MVFLAKYPGRCDDCREPVNVGDQVEYKGDLSDRRLVHVVCDSPGHLSDLDRDAELPVCPTHWMIQPCGECEMS